MSRRVVVDLAESALMLECLHCSSGWVVQSHTEQSVAIWRCPGCATELRDDNIKKLVDAYRYLVAAGKEADKRTPRVKLIATVG